MEEELKGKESNGVETGWVTTAAQERSDTALYWRDGHRAKKVRMNERKVKRGGLQTPLIGQVRDREDGTPASGLGG